MRTCLTISCGVILAWMALGLAGCDGPDALGMGRAADPHRSDASLVGGPVPLAEARMVAGRCVEALPEETDAKLRTAFESAVVHLLADRSAAARAIAAAQLGEFRQPAACDALRLALREEAAPVRAAAAKALGAIRDKTTMIPLANALDDEDADVRRAAAGALGQLENPQAVDALARTLRDADAETRTAAARSLGQLRNPQAVGPLAAALQDPAVPVRAAAAGALGLLPTRDAVEPLLAALKDSAALVRYQAANALGALADSRAYAALGILAQSDPDPSVRNAAAAALKRIQP